MSSGAMQALVLAAVYGLTSLALSLLCAAAWRLGLDRRPATAAQILALRLLPSGGALLLTFAVALPAFLRYEPSHEAESAGACLIALVLLTVALVGTALARAWQALRASRRLLRDCGLGGARGTEGGRGVALIDVAAPIVAVCGGWNPRIIASRRVFEACSAEEFRQVIAHEAAHVSARDNLKLLLLIAGADALAWLPCGADMSARWRTAAEFEADERATGVDPRRRVALAAALIKVARLADGAHHPLPALSMAVAADDIDGRVRRLLAPAVPPRKSMTARLAAGALLIPILALPFDALIHRIIETLVALGR